MSHPGGLVVERGRTTRPPHASRQRRPPPPFFTLPHRANSADADDGVFIVHPKPPSPLNVFFEMISCCM